jgi:hypothetical protein
MFRSYAFAFGTVGSILGLIIVFIFASSELGIILLFVLPFLLGLLTARAYVARGLATEKRQAAVAGLAAGLIAGVLPNFLLALSFQQLLIETTGDADLSLDPITLLAAYGFMMVIYFLQALTGGALGALTARRETGEGQP